MLVVTMWEEWVPHSAQPPPLHKTKSALAITWGSRYYMQKAHGIGPGRLHGGRNRLGLMMHSSCVQCQEPQLMAGASLVLLKGLRQ